MPIPSLPRNETNPIAAAERGIVAVIDSTLSLKQAREPTAVPGKCTYGNAGPA